MDLRDLFVNANHSGAAKKRVGRQPNAREHVAPTVRDSVKSSENTQSKPSKSTPQLSSITQLWNNDVSDASDDDSMHSDHNDELVLPPEEDGCNVGDAEHDGGEHNAHISNARVLSRVNRFRGRSKEQYITLTFESYD